MSLGGTGAPISVPSDPRDSRKQGKNLRRNNAKEGLGAVVSYFREFQSRILIRK